MTVIHYVIIPTVASNFNINAALCDYMYMNYDMTLALVVEGIVIDPLFRYIMILVYETSCLC